MSEETSRSFGDRQRWRAFLDKVLDAVGPDDEWMIATSCSWRRVLTKGRGHVVLVPTVSRSDGHPDLQAGQGVFEYLAVFDPPTVRAILDRLDAVEDALEEAHAEVRSTIGESDTTKRGALVRLDTILGAALASRQASPDNGSSPQSKDSP